MRTDASFLSGRRWDGCLFIRGYRGSPAARRATRTLPVPDRGLNARRCGCGYARTAGSCYRLSRSATLLAADLTYGHAAQPSRLAHGIFTRRAAARYCAAALRARRCAARRINGKTASCLRFWLQRCEDVAKAERGFMWTASLLACLFLNGRTAFASWPA